MKTLLPPLSRAWALRPSGSWWRRPLLLAAMAMLLLATFCSQRLAAQAGSLDTSYDPNVDFYVSATGVQPDGKTIIGGGFTTVGGAAHLFLARLNADGSLDATFNPGSDVNNRVDSVAVQADGKILIGGEFTAVTGTSRNRIARLNADGSLDATFNPGSGANDNVYSMAVQADRRILVVGQFTTVNGTARSRIARLNADGSLDATFNPGSGASGGVDSVAVQADGKIVIGGSFAAFNGAARNFIARLNADGSVDATFNPGSGPNGSVEIVAVQADGKILFGGHFTTVNGTARNRIARLLNADGSLDANFNPGSGANASVASMAVQADGKILLGGQFTTVNGTARNGIARLNAGGSLDTTFDPDSGVSYTNNPLLPPASVESVAVQVDGKILLGGFFDTVNGTARNDFARLNNDAATQSLIAFDATRVQWLRGGAGPEVSQVNFELSTDGGASWTVLGAGGRIVGGWELTGQSVPAIGMLRARGRTAGGQFNGSSGLVEQVAAYNGFPPTVTTPTSASIASTSAKLGGTVASDGGTPITERGVVYSATTTNNDPLIGGAGVTKITANGTTGVFTVSATGLSLNTIYSFKAYAINSAGTGYTNPVSTFTTNAPGFLDTGYNPNVGGTVVYATAVQPDGGVIIGGTFTTVGGAAHVNLARLGDSSFTASTNGEVDAVAVQADGKIVLGGRFNGVNGTGRRGIARLNANGSLDTTFIPGTSANVYSVAVQTDGKIVVGGGGIGRLNADGSGDTTFSASVSNGLNPTFVYGVAVQADGKVLLGGEFNTVNGTARNRIARVNADGSLDTTFNPGTGANAAVYNVVVQTNTKILLGGGFFTVNGTPRGGIARLNANGSLESTASFSPAGANNTVYSVAVQADGKILLGGAFTTVGGTARNLVARLRNDAATQSLGAKGASLMEWFRGGAGPEVSPVSFELSTDGGTSWTLLGAGTRIAGGWELTGLSLPGGSLLRARGRTAGGNGNGSSGLVEQVAGIAFAPTVTAPTSASITSTSATLGGTVTSDGGAAITERGVVYSGTAVNGNPTIGGTGVIVAPVTGTTGVFTTAISGLSPGIGYSFKAYAINSVGTTYTSPVSTFTTLTALEFWRLTYFGTTANTGNAANTADPDGDGENNLFEYVAGLVPTNPASRFDSRIEAVPGFPLRKNFLFSPIVAGRTYLVKSKASLTDPNWTPLGSSSTSDNGTERTVTDLNPGSGSRFYEVEITLQ